MKIGNTFKQLFRPVNEEFEPEHKEQEQEPMYEHNHEEEPLFSHEQTYRPSEFRFLDSEVFTTNTSNVLYAEPKSHEDAEIITDAIESGKIVIVRLDALKDGQDQRVLDFVTGFCYALNILPVKTSIETQWIFDPKNRKTRTIR